MVKSEKPKGINLGPLHLGMEGLVQPQLPRFPPSHVLNWRTGLGAEDKTKTGP